ncbi:18.5 kDa class I heat shock protein-like [Euphorbia lathyris]|uniref:18.5 kDa class I heat shock protein-like n=1 Tax=Euphorbia lathyris TaxID=212925 RepID=UPI0033144D70
MSIVPINNERGTISSPFSLDFFDPERFFSSDLWAPFPPSLSANFPSFAGGIPPSLETRVDWSQNSRAHIVKAAFPGFSMEDVLVHIDDDNVLEISTESGRFMSKFKLPDDARRDGIEAAMVDGVLNIVIPKEGARNPNVRVIEIEGSD